MTATLPAPVRHAAAKATLQFDWLVPAKPFFRIREVAAIVDMSERFVEELFDGSGKQHEYNAGGGVRNTKRIPRAFLIELLIRSAKYQGETKRDALLSCLREFSQEDLVHFSKAALELAARQTG